MNRKLRKILSIILVAFILICISNVVFAKTGSELVKDFNGTNGIGTTAGEGIMKKVIGPVLSVVRIVAVGISVIMITFLGIKYMSAAPSEKATIKTQLITFTIGAIVVVGATTILDIILKAATAITTT